MERTDNYILQTQAAQRRFLTYDQDKIITKFCLPYDAKYLYPTMLHRRYRLDRHTGALAVETENGWQDANRFNPVMTLLDMLCDSADNRYLTGRWKAMQDFGLMFHRNLLEDRRDPVAEEIDRHPQIFRAACEALGGTPIPGGDIAYAIELFDNLAIGLRFWHGDGEFAPRLRYYWDENALRYIRYETMYYAVSLLQTQLREQSLLLGQGVLK